MVKFPFYTEQVRVYALPVLLFCENRLRCMIMGYKKFSKFPKIT
jgi:hypothetical protein